MTNFNFFRDLAGGASYRLGTAVQRPDGWRFLSNVAAHKNSRKMHATMEKCLPRWVGYPAKCRSEAVVPDNKPMFTEGFGGQVEGARSGIIEAMGGMLAKPCHD